MTGWFSMFCWAVSFIITWSVRGKRSSPDRHWTKFLSGSLNHSGAWKFLNHWELSTILQWVRKIFYLVFFFWNNDCILLWMSRSFFLKANLWQFNHTASFAFVTSFHREDHITQQLRVCIALWSSRETILNSKQHESESQWCIEKLHRTERGLHGRRG